MKTNKVSIQVWGDFACFTRPEMKVERVSYPVMTPSAARGILEAIFWEPQMYYIIQEIAVVRKGNWLSFCRNEVQSVISISSAKSWMRGTKSISYIRAGGGAEEGTQRNSLVLREVGYVITAEIRLSQLASPPRDNVDKYKDQLRRRVQAGKCFHRPYLGCREFAADFEWVDDPQAVNTIDWPEENLGWMLYDVFDPHERHHGFAWSKEEQVKKGQKNRYLGRQLEPQAVFFKAEVRNGRMNCDPDKVQILNPRKQGE